MTRLDDPALVLEQYATEANLRARQAVYEHRDGRDPREVLFETIAALRPRRLLEVGGGPGELAERVLHKLGADVAFVDLSRRMVELARARGVDARVGDVQELPFPDCAFDVAVAAWMLYHVPDLDRGLSELRRVLEPGGRLVAVVNGEAHLRELRELFARGPASPLTRESCGAVLGRHFVSVERRDVDGWVTIPERETVAAYIASGISSGGGALPHFEVPLRVRYATAVFVTTR